MLVLQERVQMLISIVFSEYSSLGPDSSASVLQHQPSKMHITRPLEYLLRVFPKAILVVGVSAAV